MERLLKLAHTDRLTLVCVLVENFSARNGRSFSVCYFYGKFAGRIKYTIIHANITYFK